MASEISNIYARYKESLEWGVEDFERHRRESFEALREAYAPFVSRLIRTYPSYESEGDPQIIDLVRIFREQFNDNLPEVSFTAIDGTCGKYPMSEMMVFYGASYAQNGVLDTGNDSSGLTYSRWTPSEDTSFVAYLPIPLSMMDQLEDGDWLFRADDERSTVASLHTTLMQLAEVYLAYRRVMSEDRPPKVVLLDNSLSSMLLSSDVMHLVKPYRPDTQTLGWIGAYIPRWGRNFEPADGLVAHSHPMHHDLGVPSLRGNALNEWLVAQITEHWRIGMTGEREDGIPVRLEDICMPQVSDSDKVQRIRRAQDDFGVFELRSESVVPLRRQNREWRTLRQRWYDLRELFQGTCEQLFRERRLDSLRLQYRDDSGRPGEKWMDDNDVRFLIGVGLRALIEVCWQKRVLLIGIAKDSASRYFFRNFLSVMDAGGILEVPRDNQIRGTDRTVCEMLPIIDDSLQSPWSTVEFDSAFMTVRALEDSDSGKPVIQGVRGDVVVPSDGLILRSLVHLFLERRPSKESPLMGHVLFLDRIAYPYFDSQTRSAETIKLRGSALNPLIRTSNTDSNLAQDISVLIASFLTKNLFPEAIGQPDPLHRADLGAKAMGKRIDLLVRSSVNQFRTNPLSWTFRGYRGQPRGP